MTDIPKEGRVISSATMPLPAASVESTHQRVSKVSVSFDDDSLANPSRASTPTIPADQQKPVGYGDVGLHKRSIFEEHPELIRLDLPSRFEFYPFKELGAFPIRGKHQAKFSLAAKTRSTRLVVETVSSLLSGGVSAMDLTIPDYYWVQYKLRLECFGKVPLHARAVCSNPDHALQVLENKKPRESLINMEIVNSTTLREELLDTEKLHAFQASTDLSFLTSKGLRLVVPRMRDSVELEEQYGSSDAYEEIEYLADYAACIQSLDSEKPLSLDARITVVGELGPDELSVLNTFQELIQSYGVDEQFTSKCKECGGEIKTSVSISPRDFL